MNFRISLFSARLGRGLLAAVVVLAGMLPGIPCCCGSIPCCGSPDENGLCAVDLSQECCCCNQTGSINSPEADCYCSKTSQNPSARGPGTCRCNERPVTEAVVIHDQRDEQHQDRSRWLTEPCPFIEVSESLATEELCIGQQDRIDPCAHNLRQAILCVWRN